MLIKGTVYRVRYINNENLDEIFLAAPPVAVDNEELKPPYLLKRLDCSQDAVSVTLKRKTRTRTLQVLSFEEWTNGRFLRCVAVFHHDNGLRRAYTPRESLNSIDDVIFIQGVVSSLYPEREDFVYEAGTVTVENMEAWANQSA